MMQCLVCYNLDGYATIFLISHDGYGTIFLVFQQENKFDEKRLNEKVHTRDMLEKVHTRDTLKQASRVSFGG